MFFPKDDAEMVESMDAQLDAHYLGHFAGVSRFSWLAALMRFRPRRSKRFYGMESEGHKVDPRSFKYKKPNRLFPRW